MFKNGTVEVVHFIEHITDRGAIWVDTVKEDGIVNHFFISIDGRKRVQMPIVGEDIPKATAQQWLTQLGLKK